MRKKRILFISEASYLSTGYAVYGKEVLSRIHSTGKYEIAEFSSYGAEDNPLRKTIPWKNYPNAPGQKDSKEDHDRYHSNPTNQFGAYRFERVCADFKPDIVVTITDFWMCSYVRNSPYRRLYNFVWMPTVDAEGQSAEWIAQMADCDAVTTYSDWSFDMLKEQSPKIKLVCSTPPCASPLFKPVPDKRAHKESLGLNPDFKIIGTVMRNQRRKLFPELFKAFGRYLKETGHKNTYLYCHTSYPDNGWDLARLMVQEGISSRVLFTYVCQSCNAISINKFNDTVTQCQQCRNFSCKTCSVSNGVDTATLAQIYNCFDLYAQIASSEGAGMGQAEAAACGVPVCSTDYSAMKDIVRKLNGYPVVVESLYEELETGCLRAKPSVDHLASIFKSFCSLTDEELKEKSRRALQGFHDNYNWDTTADKWMSIFEDLPYKDWSVESSKTELPEKSPDNLSNSQFVEWLLNTFLPEYNLVGSHEAQCLIRDLNFGCHRPMPCGFFYSENSYFGRENFIELKREDVFNMIKNRAQARNFWEDARTGKLTFKQESWIG